MYTFHPLVVKKSVPSRSWINMGWRPPETTSDHQYVHFAQGCQVSRNWYTSCTFTTRQSVDAACLGVNVMCAFMCFLQSTQDCMGCQDKLD
ncbi:hypothetical protein TNIN_197381 [Trichonephila inaurata madagascariensis]|uniref:Uncharacterized protein n=1 Tax=Trichonephila inaurata madagascariensis TaxID=2747483 RepID=A0A8X6YGD1_9ARAC|nr:hypothetical protein TNIN_197381 [Trichonephila inaurata madagascariensis]